MPIFVCILHGVRCPKYYWCQIIIFLTYIKAQNSEGTVFCGPGPLGFRGSTENPGALSNSVSSKRSSHCALHCTTLSLIKTRRNYSKKKKKKTRAQTRSKYSTTLSLTLRCLAAFGRCDDVTPSWFLPHSFKQRSKSTWRNSGSCSSICCILLLFSFPKFMQPMHCCARRGSHQ